VMADPSPKEFCQISIKKIPKPEKLKALHRIRLLYTRNKMEILSLSMAVQPFGPWPLFQVLNPIHIL
jgi:hypothetical protein